MKAIFFTKLMECELTVVESLRNDIYFDIVRSEDDVVPSGIFEFALFDLTWEDHFIRSNLSCLNVPGIAIVQLEGPIRLANAYLSGIKTMVFMENIRDDLKIAISRIAKRDLSFPPAVAKSILNILRKQSKLSAKQAQLLTRLSQSNLVIQISDALGIDVDDVHAELWNLCGHHHDPDSQTP